MRILFSVLLVLGVYTNSRAEVNSAPSKTVPDIQVKQSSTVQTAIGSTDEKKSQPEVQTKPTVVDNPEEKKQSITFKSLAQMNELIDLGVPALALSLLDGEQKKRPAFQADWYAFEYKRILLLSALERWQVILDRTQWLFETAKVEQHITRKIRLWFETQQVIARLQLKQSDRALNQLQHLLWASKAENRGKSLLIVWRRLVIRAYLQKHLDSSARRALIKYEREYKADVTDIDWMLLQAQVMMRTHRPQQAVTLLKQITEQDAIDVETLLLIAQLQANPKEAAAMNQAMREKLDGHILSRSARWAYSYVAYLATQVLTDPLAQIVNLEAMLSLDIQYPLFDEDYQVSADDLWDKYNEQGLVIANENELLFGNDKEWKKLSDELIKNAPEQALALNVALVLHTKNFETKKKQHQTIVEIIEQRNNGLELINKLYLHSSKVPDVNVLPDEVRYRLVDYSLSEGDYSEAARVMKSLQEPPPGNTLFDWRMRKARVLILHGETTQSENLIRKTFMEKPSITRAELDRYIQVVFDFQTVQQHQQALNLFDLLYIDGLDEKLKREIYFWKAESYFSLRKYDRAALFYLESARAIEGADNDLWGQSARFKAANALVLAEIYGDAKKVYSELLSVTGSVSRKALINQNLQKIRLLKSAAKNTQ
jgi:hypothetical protein